MVLSVEALRCAYGRHAPPVLDVETFSLAGGVCGLVGINGAGKSTLLRTLAGCRRPEAGRVSIDGTLLYGRARRNVLARIGYMPQQLDLPREMRVADALAYVGWVRDVPASTAGRRNGLLLERVGLSAKSRTRVGELSGGMNRRLALAVALVTDPDVLLLDEPTTGLDPEQRAALRDIVSDLGSGATTILSSHVMEDVAAMSERIVVLHQGRIVHDGSTASFVSERGGPESSAELAFLATIAQARP